MAELDERTAVFTTGSDFRLYRRNGRRVIWQATLQSAPQADMPAAFLRQVKSVVDEITKSKQAAETDRARVLTLQSDLLLEEARSRTALGTVARAQGQALKDLLVQDGQPIWTAPSTLTSEWKIRVARPLLHNGALLPPSLVGCLSLLSFTPSVSRHWQFLFNGSGVA
jgi:hypothetical protein